MDKAPSERTWPPVNLPAHIESYRKLIAADRTLYGRYRSLLEKRAPEVWVPVGEALKMRARYYRGEMIRAKNDTQRYALGEDPKEPSAYASRLCAWLDEYLKALRPALIELQETGARLSGLDTNERDSAMYGMAASSMELLVDQIINVTKDIERSTYAG